MNKFGYVRVSSRDQNENRQLDAMDKEGIRPQDIFVDKQSGKDFDRPAYNKLLRRLKKNDVVFILSIDRLGRSYLEIQNEWNKLVHEKNVDIVVLDMPLLDTRRDKDLLGTFVSDIVLQILSFVAENERKNIRERQAEGIRAAQMRGVRLGRPAKQLPGDFYQAALLWRSGEITCAEASRRCGVAQTTFRRKAGQLAGDAGDCDTCCL